MESIIDLEHGNSLKERNRKKEKPIFIWRQIYGLIKLFLLYQFFAGGEIFFFIYFLVPCVRTMKHACPFNTEYTLQSKANKKLDKAAKKFFRKKIMQIKHRTNDKQIGK